MRVILFGVFAFLLSVLIRMAFDGTLTGWLYQDEEPIDVRDIRGSSYTLNSEDADFISRSIDENGVEFVLSRMASALNEGAPLGAVVDDYNTVLDRAAAENKNLFMSYTVDPSEVDTITPGQYIRDTTLLNCTSRAARLLLEEGVTIYHYYWLPDDSERFAAVVVDNNRCKHYTIEN